MTHVVAHGCSYFYSVYHIIAPLVNTPELAPEVPKFCLSLIPVLAAGTSFPVFEAAGCLTSLSRQRQYSKQ
jgi:hypothetical protein